MRVETVVDALSSTTSDTGTRASVNPRLLEAMAISNDAFISPNGDVTGDPTEVALCVFAAKPGSPSTRLKSGFQGSPSSRSPPIARA